MNKIRVGVAFGGRSAEHEVSLQSAKNVLNALDREKYEPVLIGIDREGRWHLEDETLLLYDAVRPLPGWDGDHDHEVTLAVRGEGSRLISLSEPRESDALDVVFPVLHGPFGEDGSIQGLCRLANIPCVGAGILGSAVGMDKDVMKRLLREAGIATARFRAISRGKRSLGFDEAKAELGSPLFVKPANMGSSVGVSKARTRAEYDVAVETALQYDVKVLVEECVVGRELECSVLGNAEPLASVPGEIETGAGHAFYDYGAKYIDENGATLLIPAPLGAWRRRRGSRHRGPRLHRSLLRGDGAGRHVPPRLWRAPRKRDQHDSGLHSHQHVSQALGGERPFLHPTGRPTD